MPVRIEFSGALLRVTDDGFDQSQRESHDKQGIDGIHCAVHVEVSGGDLFGRKALGLNSENVPHGNKGINSVDRAVSAGIAGVGNRAVLCENGRICRNA